MTANIQKRLVQHNKKYSIYTKRGSNWKLIYSESFSTSAEARIREKYFKNTAGKEWLKRRGIT